jgi:hypothetical protein
LIILSFIATTNNLATFSLIYYVITHFPEKLEPTNHWQTLQPTELISVVNFLSAMRQNKMEMNQLCVFFALNRNLFKHVIVHITADCISLLWFATFRFKTTVWYGPKPGNSTEKLEWKTFKCLLTVHTTLCRLT